MRRRTRSHALARAQPLTASAGTAPFDRHDWYVDRCGRPVRYVIDFYFDESKAGSMDAFELDVRPALDDWSSLLDRAKMGVRSKHFSHSCSRRSGGRRCTCSARATTFPAP